MKQARATVGETVVFELDSNPDTGYAWNIVSADGLRVSDDTYDVESSDDTTGPAGKHVFRVMADAPGTYVFHAEYRGRNEDSAVDGFTVELEISEKS